MGGREKQVLITITIAKRKAVFAPNRFTLPTCISLVAPHDRIWGAFSPRPYAPHGLALESGGKP